MNCMLSYNLCINIFQAESKYYMFSMELVLRNYKDALLDFVQWMSLKLIDHLFWPTAQSK